MSKIAILQARMGSSRLPGKVLKSINGKPMIEWQISRIQKSKVGKIILATSDDASDDELVRAVRSLGVEVYRGSQTDVHSRFIRILEMEQPEYFIRLTGDCPVVMPDLINDMISEFEFHQFDYLSNVNPPTYPDGLDIEIVSTQKFLEFSSLELTDEEREHVTLCLRQRSDSIKFGNFLSKQDFSKMRWTVDYEEDLKFISNIFRFFEGRETQFSMSDIIDAISEGKVPDNSIPHNFRNISLRKGN